MSIFAPAEFFSSVAIAVDDDPDLQHGTHVRVLPSVGLGLPLAPLALWRVRAELIEPEVVWRNGFGQLVPRPDLDAAGGTLYADLLAPPAAEPKDQVLDVAVDVRGSFDGVAALVDAVHGADREYCRRSVRPFLLSAPRVNRLRLQGRGVAELVVWRLRYSLTIEQLLNSRPHALMSLPIDGSRAWYVGGLGAAQAMDAVRSGAPRRLTPADRPDGPFDALTPSHEEQRVQPHAAGILHLLDKVLGDSNVRPAAQLLLHDAVPQGRTERHWLELHGQNHLLTQAMDPGLARFIGLARRVDDLPAPGEPVAWITMSLFAVTRFLGVTHVPSSLYDVLGDQPPVLAGLVERYRQYVEEASGRAGELAAVTGRIAQGRNVAVRPVLCACGAVPPPDRPTLGAPDQPPERARWIGREPEPSNAFRQDFIWRRTPFGGLVALGRREGGAWRTRHQDAPLAQGSDSPPRALPMLMGRTGSGPQATAGLLSDQPIPADPADPAPPAVRYRCAFADLFGRYGPPAEFDVVVPARPVPPAPRLQAEVVLDGPVGSEPGALSPGRVNVTVPVPQVADLAAGSLALARLQLAFDGVAAADVALEPLIIEDLAAKRKLPVVETSIALPPLEVAAQATSQLSAVFVGPFHAVSALGQVAVRYNDRRPLPVVPCGPGLFWTSRPGPAPEVELRLSWPAPKGARYRVYIADARSLGLPPGPRANQAVEAGARARDKRLGGRDRFRLLGDVTESGERALLDERLPRSLSGLQVLRFVPVTSEGREAPFDDCPVVPVAVPSERRAPMPSVEVVIDRQSGRPRVRISAEGFDWEWLRAAEPGLFTDPPDPDALAPEFRLRRAFGAAPDPLYASEVRRGKLAVVPATGGGWEATAEFEIDKPLPPFVPVAWWAEVRPGAERRVRAGYAEPRPAGGVLPTTLLHREDAPFAFSVPSAPVLTMYMPPPVPAPEVFNPAIREAGGRSLRFELAAPPVAHAHAGKFRLRVWEQWGDHMLRPAGEDVVLDGTPVVWEGPVHALEDTPLPASLVVVYVDPIDRLGVMRRITL